MILHFEKYCIINIYFIFCFWFQLNSFSFLMATMNYYIKWQRDSGAIQADYRLVLCVVCVCV